MNKWALRSVLFLAGVYVLAYLFFFVLQLLQYPEETLLYFYKVPWIFEEALRLFITHFPVLTTSGVLLAFSTYPAEQTELFEGTGVISGSTSRTIILFLILTLIYSVLSIGLLPSLYEHRHNRIYESNLAQSYLQQAETAEAEGNVNEAYTLYKDYLSIDTKNREIKDKVNYLEGQVTLQEAQKKKKSTEGEPQDPLLHDKYRNMSAAQLVEAAEKALHQEDPFTAHYMALLAQRVAQQENESREDAKRLAAKAWEEIGSLEPNREEQRAYQFYNKKVSGYQALTRRQPVKAYYIFKELLEEKPGDRDVKKYYKESVEQARRVSYFIDEAKRFRSNPGTRKIVYTDENNNLVFIEKLIIENGESWVYGIEIFNYKDSDKGSEKSSDKDLEKPVPTHISAPYGKITGKSLIMRGIDRNLEGHSIEPVVYNGHEDVSLPTVFTITPSLPQLMRLSREQEFLNRLNLPDLLSLQPVITQYGYPSYQFEVLTLMRILEPFLFLIFSVCALAFGWHTRVHKSGFPWLVVFLAPLLPFILDKLIILYEYLHQLLFTAVVLQYGFITGAVGLLVLEGILLFLAIFSVAMQKEL